MSIDTDTGIYEYFKSHWRHFFPTLGSRSQFVKQAANLWAVKQNILEIFTRLLNADRETIHLVDGFPIPLCHFKRAPRCQKFKGVASYGHCASKGETYYGFKGHLLVDYHGVITSCIVSHATVDERDALKQLLDKVKGQVIGDKGYISKELQSELQTYGIYLQTPLRDNMNDTRPKEYVRLLMKRRRLIETVIGQLTERFNIAKVWARDLWHFTGRITRKLLAHTIAVYANKSLGRNPIVFEGLIT